MNISSKRFGFAIEGRWLAPEIRYIGYKHDYYDGNFWCFGFWFCHIYVSTNPHTYMTECEIKTNIEAWKANRRDK